MTWTVPYYRGTGGAAGSDDVSAVGQPGMGLALLLTTISGLTTGLGGLLVVLPQGASMTDGSLGMWQAAAAGFMCSVTLVEVRDHPPAFPMFQIIIRTCSDVSMYPFKI